MLEKLEVKDWLELNAKLQQKKNALRASLAQRGVLKREGDNKFDRYKYFSEAQYKILFTELFSAHRIELKFDELQYQTFEGSEKQANGRMPQIKFSLIDIDTGFYETSVITGEGIDKGDKAGYKAYTGALKYFLANTFMVATGDDPEEESPQNAMNKVNRNQTPKPMPEPAQDPTKVDTSKVMPSQIEFLLTKYKGPDLEKLLAANNITRIEDLPRSKANDIIQYFKSRGE